MDGPVGGVAEGAYRERLGGHLQWVLRMLSISHASILLVLQWLVPICFKCVGNAHLGFTLKALCLPFHVDRALTQVP